MGMEVRNVRVAAMLIPPIWGVFYILYPVRGLEVFALPILQMRRLRLRKIMNLRVREVK